MKTNFRRLALAAMLLSSPTILTAADGSSVVSDLPGFGEDAYFAEDAATAQAAAAPRPQTQQQAAPHLAASQQQVAQPVSHTEYIGDGTAQQYGTSRVVEPATVPAHPQYAPVTSQSLRTVGHHASSSSCDSGCDGGCGKSTCDGGCSKKHRRKILGALDRGSSDTWASLEGLLWFTQDRNAPPLVVSSNAGTLPVLPQDNAANVDGAESVFGDDLLGELAGGFRVDGGAWLTGNVGIGGRFWILNEFNDSFAFAGDGANQSIGRSFFNSSAGFQGEDSLVVAITGAPVGPDTTGEIIGDNSLEIFGAEGYGRFRFAGTKTTQLDFIGGYSHFEIDDTLTLLSSTTISANPGLGQAIGDTSTFLDAFNTENNFNGGQLGFEFKMAKGKWFASSLTKVHFGNNNQTLQINGSSTLAVAGGAPVTNAGGILAGSTPVEVERDVFSFAPEANFKLGYRFRPNVLLSVGYSFIYWDNVALTGDAIDRVVDGSTLGTGANLNGFDPDEDSSLWVQGIDLGFIIDF